MDTLDLPGFHFDSHYLQLPEGKVHYLDEGEGPVILLLHGNPTWCFLYRQVIRFLRENYRCIAPDYLGMGLSDKPKQADYTLTGHVNRLQQFTEALGLGPVHLAVQDWGGPIGLGWAAANKTQVQSLTIMNSFAFNVKASEFSLRNLFNAGLIAGMKVPGYGEALVQGMNGFSRWGLPRAIRQKRHKTKAILNAYQAPYEHTGHRRAILQLVREIPLTRRHPNWEWFEDLEFSLRGWQVPNILVWGMNDPVFNFRLSERFTELMPNVHNLLKLEDTGHLVPEEEPEVLAAEMQEFFAGLQAQRKLIA